jgi:hypothetical protein
MSPGSSSKILLVLLANKRTYAMSDKTTGLDLIDEEILSYEVSDESLETAATAKAGAYTLGFCTGLSACPA